MKSGAKPIWSVTSVPIVRCGVGASIQSAAIGFSEPSSSKIKVQLTSLGMLSDPPIVRDCAGAFQSAVHNIDNAGLVGHHLDEHTHVLQILAERL